MDIFEFFINHFEKIIFIFYNFILFVGGYYFGYTMGNFHCIKDDLKSLDYDNILRENKQLRDAIEIKKKK